jgi:hypothetical protein
VDRGTRETPRAKGMIRPGGRRAVLCSEHAGCFFAAVVDIHAQPVKFFFGLLRDRIAAMQQPGAADAAGRRCARRNLRRGGFASAHTAPSGLDKGPQKSLARGPSKLAHCPVKPDVSAILAGSYPGDPRGFETSFKSPKIRGLVHRGRVVRSIVIVRCGCVFDDGFIAAYEPNRVCRGVYIAQYWRLFASP